jgi:hypothetical protein
MLKIQQHWRLCCGSSEEKLKKWADVGRKIKIDSQDINTTHIS